MNRIVMMSAWMALIFVSPAWSSDGADDSADPEFVAFVKKATKELKGVKEDALQLKTTVDKLTERVGRLEEGQLLIQKDLNELKAQRQAAVSAPWMVPQYQQVGGCCPPPCCGNGGGGPPPGRRGLLRR